MAAVLACGPGAVLSHLSARASVEHVRFARAGGSASAGGWSQGEMAIAASGCTRRGRLEPFEVTIERGIPVATIERVLLDLAARTDAKRLERIFVAGLQDGPPSWPRLGSRHRARPWTERHREPAPHRAGSRSAGTGDKVSHRGRLPGAMPGGEHRDSLGQCPGRGPSRRLPLARSESCRRNRQLAATTAIALPSSATARPMSTSIAAGYDVHRTTYKMLERNPDPFLEQRPPSAPHPNCINFYTSR